MPIGELECSAEQTSDEEACKMRWLLCECQREASPWAFSSAARTHTAVLFARPLMGLELVQTVASSSSLLLVLIVKPCHGQLETRDACYSYSVEAQHVEKP